MTPLPKTREIPIGDFYERLQLEYLSYRFRALIYQRPFDKKKFTDICQKKKEKIDQIALENCLPTIFNHAGQQEKYLKRFFRDSGLPAFCYRDEYQEKVKGFYDVVYYFVVGSSVRFLEGKEVMIGRVQECMIPERKIIIETETGEVERDFNQVTRIFPSDFFEKLFL